MRSLPDHFDAGDLPGLLAEGWAFDVENATYVPLGGGSYHWVVESRGERGFATLDDLDQKPWLGASRDEVFDGLRRAFETAAALHAAGLEFVVAPLLSGTGESVRRISDRHALALFPYVRGDMGTFGRYEPDERAAVVTILERLHEATPLVASIARQFELDVPSRAQLETALCELDEPWTAGPLGEQARALIATRRADILELIGHADRLRADLHARSTEPVVTHGEPHGGNLMRTTNGFLLVDWDTVALAPRERDLWMLGECAGHVDETSTDFFRLAWDLGDLAAFVHELRISHSENADTLKALWGVEYCLDTGARAAFRG